MHVSSSLPRPRTAQADCGTAAWGLRYTRATYGSRSAKGVGPEDDPAARVRLEPCGEIATFRPRRLLGSSHFEIGGVVKVMRLVESNGHVCACGGKEPEAEDSARF